MLVQLVTQSGQRKYLTKGERNNFIQATKKVAPIDRTFCLMLVHTGCLISEALNIRFQDIKLSERKVIIHTLRKRKKNTDFRAVPLSDYYMNELVYLHKLNHRNTTSLNSKLWNWARMTGYRKVMKVMKKAGIEGYHATPLGIRHTFGLYCAEKDVPLSFIQKWMGHSSLEITQMYLFNKVQDERAIAKRIWS